MRFNAYIVAADPAWLEQSIKAYYRNVARLIVSYDRSGLSWSGSPTKVDECLDILRKLDVDKKMIFEPGDYHDSKRTPIENDTLQRQAALAIASINADWILELDTDEVVPDANYLIGRVSEVGSAYKACWWPMRVIFKQLNASTFLQVASPRGFDWYERPGPIACRPGTTLIQARVSTDTPYAFGVSKTPLQRILERRKVWHHRDQAIPANKSVIHFSWARSEVEIRRKLAGWSHSRDFDAESYLNSVWLPAEKKRRFLRNFHPITPESWPALKRVRLAPQGLET